MHLTTQGNYKTCKFFFSSKTSLFCFDHIELVYTLVLFVCLFVFFFLFFFYSFFLKTLCLIWKFLVRYLQNNLLEELPDNIFLGLSRLKVL